MGGERGDERRGRGRRKGGGPNEPRGVEGSAVQPEQQPSLGGDGGGEGRGEGQGEDHTTKYNSKSRAREGDRCQPLPWLQ